MAASRKELWEYLKERREERKGSLNRGARLEQADIAKAIGQSQSQVSKFERGLIDVYSANADWLYGLMVAYGLTRAEIDRAIEDFELRKVREYLVRKDRMLSTKEGPKVQHLGIVNAGMIGVSEFDTTGRAVTVPDEIAAKYDLSDVFAVDVTGDSMVSDDVRESIPAGSRVFFHHRLNPTAGEVVCVYLVDDDHSVIKKYEPNRDFVLLRSHNDKHEPIVLRPGTEVILQGVYLAHQVLSHRAR